MSVLFAMALQAAAATSELPPNTCQPAASCRFVRSFTLRRGATEMPVKADRWVPLVADGALQIFPGETMVIVIGANGGGVSVISAGRAADLPRTADDAKAESAAIAMDGGSGEHVNANKLGKTAVRPENDTVRITFTQAADKDDMVLRHDDGYAMGFTYRAQMLTEHGVDPTTVCPVGSHKVGYEGWPYPIMQLRLSQFALAKVERHVLTDCK